MVAFEDIYQHVIGRLEQELPAYLHYHCSDHTKYVLKQSIFLAAQEDISGEDLCLLKIAALYHDIGFIEDRKDHEARSCRIASEELKSKIKKQELAKVCGMIMATRIPQKPKTNLEKILADADLEYLGTDLFPEISNNLYKEISHFEPDMDFVRWNELQISFISNHQYHTEYCRKYREPKKQENLQQLKEEKIKGSAE